MASNGSSKTVFLAFSVNFFIAGVKTVIAVITSSSAMFSEAGPNKIQAPKAEAVKLVVKENNPIFLLAVR